MPSDEQLVRRARGGDREAFSALVCRYERAALAVACKVLRCSHDARDAAQDAFVTAYEKLNQLWTPCRFGSWILRITHRMALRHLRRRRNDTPKLDGQRDSPRLPPASTDIMSLVSRLPEQERVVVLMR